MKRCTLVLVLLVAVLQSQAYDPIYQWMLITKDYSYLNNALDETTRLPASNGINDMVEDNNGLIWLGIDHAGVRTFDGKKLKDPKYPNDCFVAKGIVLSLACDSKNNIWIGTSLGLVKYDGTNWTDIDETVTGIRAVTDIVVTATDKVYITGLVKNEDEFIGGGAAFFNGENWTSYNKSNSAIPDNILEDLTMDNNGHLWALVGDHKQVVKFDGKNWKVFNNASSEFPAAEVHAIATNKSGKMWFATPKGIAEYDGSKWGMRGFTNGFSPRLLEYTSGDGSLDVISLTVEDNGTVWLGTRDKGVFYMKNDRLRAITQANSPLVQNSVMKIAIDKNNRKWFVTGYKNTDWAKYYPRNKMNMNNVTYTNNAGGITVFKEYSKIDDPKWLVYDNTSADLKLGTTFTIDEMNDGTILMPNTGDGLVTRKDGKFTTYTHSNPMQSAFDRMFVAPDGKIYLNASVGGVKVFENGKVNDFAKWPNMGGVTGMAYDNTGSFWVSGTGGISKLNNNEWQTFDKKHGDLPTVIFYSILKDSKGTLWAGSEKGLAKFDGANWQVMSKKEIEFPSDDITVVTEAKDGKIWLGTKAGISIFDGTNWTHISKIESPKVSKFTVNSISFDKNGVAYIATENDGLLRYDGTSWMQLDRKNTATIFDKVTAVKAASNGKIYVATETSMFNDTDFTLPSQSPSAQIEQGIKKKIKEAEPKHVFAIIEI